MSSTNKAGMRAGVLGLAVGCGVAVWLPGWVIAGPVANPPPPRPLDPAKPAATPASPLAGQLGQLGGQQLGQQFGGRQLGGTPVLSPEDDEMRLRFPLESLAERLDYEKAGRDGRVKAEAAPRMTQGTHLRLDEFEERIGEKHNNARTRALMELHVGRVRQFVNSPSFGVGRFGGMPSNPPLGTLVGPPLSPVDLEYPKSAPLLFAPERDADPGPQAAEASRQQAARKPGPNMLAGLHERGLLDFLDPAGFGYVKDREHVAGFEPHQFRRAPELADAAERWAVVRLELVSLLKHKGPVAYVTGVLPSMEDADRAKTRLLGSFEEKALTALRDGDDLVTETSGGRIRMVGSLRAGKQCLDCHGVERGDLLGAFSWELERQPVTDSQTSAR